MIRFVISHRTYGNAVTIDGPTSKADRNHLRNVLRHAEKSKLAGRDE